MRVSGGGGGVVKNKIFSFQVLQGIFFVFDSARVCMSLVDPMPFIEGLNKPRCFIKLFFPFFLLAFNASACEVPQVFTCTATGNSDSFLF